jgi:predicted Zn-dependent protease
MEGALAASTFSPEDEVTMGQGFSKEVEKEYTIVSVPEANAWLDKMGQRIVDYAKTDKQFTFYLVDTPEVNAFAIPGGHCYVNIGLILYAENEAQVAAVVGHEISHVTESHGLRQIVHERGVLAFSDVVAAQVSSVAAQQAAAAATKAIGVGIGRQYSRQDEDEADSHGIDAMYHAGWDPRQGQRFFERLLVLQGNATPGFLQSILSTHPPTQERITKIQKQIGTFDLSKPLVTNSPEFQALQKILAKQFPQDASP